MARGVAINVGANTNEPGFRGPIYPDGSFAFVPIPESKPADGPPTYADLGLDLPLPPGVAETPVHLDPEFAEFPLCSGYTYGDPYGVKARPLLDLEAGDYALFYTTLDFHDDGTRERSAWIAPDWGAYVVGQFRLACDPVEGEAFFDLEPDLRDRLASNAHLRREEFDARVLLLGDPDESELYDRVVPLSSPKRGADPNRIVTDLSSDSGKGPWWRRPLRFDEEATDELLAIRERGAFEGL